MQGDDIYLPAVYIHLLDGSPVGDRLPFFIRIRNLQKGLYRIP